jgi:hypothetical protein
MPSWCQIKLSSLCSQATYPHSGMQSPGNLIILLKPGTASEDLWQPELTYGTLHMANLALCWSGRFYPLRWFPSNTAYHVRMGQSLWGPLLRLDIQGRGNRLCDPRVQRRRPAWDDQVAVDLIARSRTAIAITSPRTDERSVCVEGWGHCVGKCRFQDFDVQDMFWCCVGVLSCIFRCRYVIR